MHARRCVVFTYQYMPHARRAAGYVISRWPSRAVFTKTVAALSFRPYPWLGRFVRNMIMLKTPWLRDEYHAYDITDKFSAAFFITVRLLSYVDWLIYSWHSFDSRLHETLRSFRSEYLAFICTDRMNWNIRFTFCRNLFVGWLSFEEYLSQMSYSENNFAITIVKARSNRWIVESCYVGCVLFGDHNV